MKIRRNHIVLVAAFLLLSLPPNVAFPKSRFGNSPLSGSGKRFEKIFHTPALAAAPAPTQTVQIGTVEDLYAAVNDPGNAGVRLILAPGLYMLSAVDPSGIARANGGRLELQENMSLLGLESDRTAVTIDAADLPASSYSTGIGTLRTGAIRIGRGRNSIEWMTLRNARLGTANIDTSLQWPGTAIVRIANIASYGSQRGLDIVNHGRLGASGRTIEADIIDSDFYDNNVPSCQNNPCQGVRAVNNATLSSAIIARMTGNRFSGQLMGRLIANNGATNSTVQVFSAGNRAFGNGAGIVILGANAGLPANGNSIDFQAHGDRFVDNTATPFPDLVGGMVVLGADNVSLSTNVANNNSVNVSLWGCRIERNGTWDLFAVGARSIPDSVGPAGANNHVTITIHGERQKPVPPSEFIADGVPGDPSLNNSVTVIR